MYTVPLEKMGVSVASDEQLLAQLVTTARSLLIHWWVFLMRALNEVQTTLEPIRMLQLRAGPRDVHAHVSWQRPI